MTKPYKSGTFKVTDGHVLNYELFGNPRGIPVLYLHGGPGSGYNDKHKSYFNPKRYNVIFYDQRGSGKSTPFASIHENTTQKLIQDIKALLDFLGFKKVIVFGGSWGSTLGLIFVIEHKEYVSALIVWGVFLGTKGDIKHYYQGGVKKFFPERWERFVGLVPISERKNIPSYYLKRMSSSSKDSDKYAFEWAFYESSFLAMSMTEKEIIDDLNEFPYKALCILEAYYMTNNCFLPNNYILKNASKLSGIPTSIIQGRYDFICPSVNAYNLHKKIKGSKLSFVNAAHSATKEKAIKEKIISELEIIANLVQLPSG